MSGISPYLLGFFVYENVWSHVVDTVVERLDAVHWDEAWIEWGLVDSARLCDCGFVLLGEVPVCYM